MNKQWPQASDHDVLTYCLESLVNTSLGMQKMHRMLSFSTPHPQLTVFGNHNMNVPDEDIHVNASVWLGWLDDIKCWDVDTCVTNTYFTYLSHPVGLAVCDFSHIHNSYDAEHMLRGNESGEMARREKMQTCQRDTWPSTSAHTHAKWYFHSAADTWPTTYFTMKELTEPAAIFLAFIIGSGASHSNTR